MWGVVFNYDPVEQFRRAWSYLLQECEVPQSWEMFTPTDDRSDEITWTTCAKSWDEIPEPLIVLQPQDGTKVQGTQSLYEFVHPANAYYYFGSDHRDTWDYHFDGRQYETVFIPEAGYMYSFHAAAMVIYDRKLKAWRS